MLLVVPHDDGPVASLKVPDSVHGACGDISWTDVVVAIETVIAGPVRRKSGAALGKHLKSSLPTADHTLCPP